MEESVAKMRKLQEGNTGKPKGMLDAESSSAEPKVSGEQWPLGLRPRRQFARG